MAKTLDPKKTNIIEELVTSNMFKIEALIDVLDKKGIVNKKEILDMILKMKKKKN